jgi:imidazole glycerol-phosphate synthase subunit HisF
MYKRRLIPVLFLKDGWMVRSQNFDFHQHIGDPIHHVRRMVQWDVDELIVIDIDDSDEPSSHSRADYRHQPVSSVTEFINLIAVECNIPLTFGGRIRNLEDIRLRIQNGADKITLNSVLMDEPDVVTQAAHNFGSQAIVASIDYRMIDEVAQVFVHHGNVDTGVDVIDWAKRALDLGAGEILLNSIDRDGKARGYDLAVINKVADAVSAPVIACGGAGNPFDFIKCFQKTRASAVAAGNIYHFTENAYPNAKKLIKAQLKDIR